MNKIIFFGLVSLSVLSISCKRPPSATPPNAQREEIEKFIVQEVDFKYFSSRAKLTYKDDKTDVTTGVIFRIKKDSIIWMTVSPGLNIEVMRCLIRPDSIFILDKINNKYSEYGLDYLKSTLNLDISFHNLQAMIVGNLPFDKSYNDKLTKDSTFYLLQQAPKNIHVDNTVRVATMKLEKLFITEKPSNNSLTIEYSSFAPLETYVFPFAQLITLNYKTDKVATSNTSITVIHNKVEISDKPLNFPFNVPRRYENR
jgi:hypothetical protein